MLGVVHADELAVAGGAYGNFDRRGAAAYGLCVGVGGMLGADVAGTAVGDEEFIGLVEQLDVRGALCTAASCARVLAAAWASPAWSMRAAGASAEAPMKPRRLQILRGLRNAVTVVVLFSLWS